MTKSKPLLADLGPVGQPPLRHVQKVLSSVVLPRRAVHNYPAVPLVFLPTELFPLVTQTRTCTPTQNRNTKRQRETRDELLLASRLPGGFGTLREPDGTFGM